MLTTDELVLTLPRELIRPHTFSMRPGSTILIGGLARLDYVQGMNSIRYCFSVQKKNENIIKFQIYGVLFVTYTHNDMQHERRRRHL